jgi:vitamin B12 transporter
LNTLPLNDPFGRSSGYINGSGGISRGAEFSAEARPARDLTITGSYTYTNANTDRDSILPGYYNVFDVPRHSGSLVAIKQWGKRLTTTLDLYKYSSALNSHIAYGRAYLIPGYTKADLVGGYQFWSKDRQSARVYGKIHNMFDKSYYPGGYRAPGLTALGGVGLFVLIAGDGLWPRPKSCHF